MTEAATIGDDELKLALRVAILAHPEGVEAGPKALQATDPRFAAVSFQKFKKLATAAKATVKEEQEQAKIEAAKPKVGGKGNCAARCGLTRFITNHSSYCCDICRCYLPEGAPMW